MGSEDFKSFCRALITSGVGSIPTRSRQLPRGVGVGVSGPVCLSVILAGLAILPGLVALAAPVAFAGPVALLAPVVLARPVVSTVASDPIVDMVVSNLSATGSDPAGDAAPSDSADGVAVPGSAAGAVPPGATDGLATTDSTVAGPLPDSSLVVPPASLDDQFEPKSPTGGSGVHTEDPGRGDGRPSVAWTTIKSGIVPGWGQLVNRKPLKAGLFFGAWAFFAGQAYAAEQDRKAAQQNFDQSGSAEDMNAVNAAVDERNSRLWWMGGVAIFSMLDAYVDVHFWKFEEQWSARLAPSPEGGALLAIRLRLD